MKQEPSTSLYDTLRVLPTASGDEVRQAYRRLVHLHHPDRQSGEDDSEAIARINQAYEVLSDTHQRTLYDAGRRPAAPAPSRRRSGKVDMGRYALHDTRRARMLRLGVFAAALLLMLGIGGFIWRALTGTSATSVTAATPPTATMPVAGSATAPAPDSLKLTPALALGPRPRSAAEAPDASRR